MEQQKLELLKLIKLRSLGILIYGNEGKEMRLDRLNKQEKKILDELDVYLEIWYNRNVKNFNKT